MVEIQFFDYIWPAYMQIRNELALMRWRSNNAFACAGRRPRHLRRLPQGRRGLPLADRRRGLHQHARACAWSVPSTALDANGLLRTAIRCDDPVLFLEHKHLYRQTYNKAPNPGPNFMIPFGKAKVVRPGTDLTVVTYGALVQRSLWPRKQRGGAARAQRRGHRPALALAGRLGRRSRESVRKTNRVIVAYEDSLSWGYGAEIAARIADELFD